MDSSRSSQIQGASSQIQMKEVVKPMTADAYLLELNAKQINGSADIWMKIPLDALMLAVMAARAELLQNGLQEAVGDIQDKNQKLKGLNSIMAKARQAKQGSGEGSKKTLVPQEIKDYFRENGIPGAQGSHLNSGDWDMSIENLKGRSESLTSTSQLQMTKLQSLTGKHNQTFEMLSQFISKYFRNTDSIIKNI